MQIVSYTQFQPRRPQAQKRQSVIQNTGSLIGNPLTQDRSVSQKAMAPQFAGLLDSITELFDSKEDKLYLAAWRGHLKKISRLLKKGANINMRHYACGSPPLHAAIYGNQHQAVSLLLDKGADINATDYFGYTALHRAVLWGKDEAITLLLDRGADISLKDEDGRTPVDLISIYVSPAARERLEQARQQGTTTKNT